MANNTKNKTYWPHMIMGFLLIGITLGYWTVKHAITLPVQESNEYMMKYQQADIHINEISKRKSLFDKEYSIQLSNVKMATVKLENAKRAKEEKVVVLNLGTNTFAYNITNKNGDDIKDANITFLLTRPHTVSEDIYVKDIAIVDDRCTIKDINISKPGRYTLQLKAKIGEAVGYLQTPAYLYP